MPDKIHNELKRELDKHIDSKEIDNFARGENEIWTDKPEHTFHRFWNKEYQYVTHTHQHTHDKSGGGILPDGTSESPSFLLSRVDQSNTVKAVPAGVGFYGPRPVEQPESKYKGARFLSPSSEFSGAEIRYNKEALPNSNRRVPATVTYIFNGGGSASFDERQTLLPIDVLGSQKIKPHKEESRNGRQFVVRIQDIGEDAWKEIIEDGQLDERHYG